MDASIDDDDVVVDGDHDIMTRHVGLRSDEFIVHGFDEDDDDEEAILDTKKTFGSKSHLSMENLHLDNMQSLSEIQYEGLRMKHRMKNKEAFNPPLKKRYSGLHHHHQTYSM